MSKLQTFPVYPSQLQRFKAIAKQFAQLISHKSQSEFLSSFKRNDWLAQGLGYKGHSDLVQSAKFRTEPDFLVPFVIFFDNEPLCQAIINLFCSNLPAIPQDIIEEAADEMIYIECDYLLNAVDVSEEELRSVGCTLGVIG